jgi:UDP-N-acetylmuramate--alanine ligase
LRASFKVGGRAHSARRLDNFSGVTRRFTRTGPGRRHRHRRLRHHPVEIAAVLRDRARVDQGPGDRGHAAASLFAARDPVSSRSCTCFNDADTVLVAHVYPAASSRSPAPTATRCARHARARPPAVIPLDGPQEIAGIVKRLARPGDIVVFLGAGNITQWAYALPGELAATGKVA